MSPDPLSPVRPGDPLSESIGQADTVNAILDTARQVRGGRLAPRLPKGTDPGFPGTVVVLVRNDSGGDLDARSVVVATGATVSPTTFPYDVQRRPCFEVDEPAAATDQPLILLDPIPDGSIGKAAAEGVAVVDVHITDAGHEYARPVASDPSKLESATTGPARILTGGGATGSAVRCVVLLGLSGGESGERWMRVTATLPTADPGPYEGTGVELVGGAWADVSPTVTYTDVYRAPSNITPPKIPIGQRVRLIPSPTDPGSWEIAAVGGMQTVTFDVEQDWACETPAEVELTGRDLSVVVTPGSSDVKTVTSPSFLYDFDIDTETCEIAKTYKVWSLNLCTLEWTLEDPP